MILPLVLSVLFVFSSYLLVLSRHNGYLIATLHELCKEKQQYYYTEGLLSYGIALYKNQGHTWHFPVTKQVSYGGKEGLVDFTKTDALITVKASSLPDHSLTLTCVLKLHKDGTITLQAWHKVKSIKNNYTQS
ncbi:hypothetical protein H0X48_00395 [Candidatus Dependentiae bacterium]|nr:hypothetical protein [Candidatus Dependentiae bacterium]